MLERAFGLSTDLYELTMAAAYFQAGAGHRATFELFVRSLPPNRSYLIAAGLEQVLDYLSNLSFTGDQIEYLRRLQTFKGVSSDFFEYLGQLRFSGDVWAMPEGAAAFAMEPFLRVEAPIIEAQIVETFLLSVINFETLVASKAARVVTAARGRGVVDFGTRRAHGSEAGLLAARAAYIGGCMGTSNVEAGYLFGIPVFGTMAHSFVMSFDDEMEAFRAFLRVFPDTATLLVDTYDTLGAIERIARELGPGIPAIRLDSGDLAELSHKARALLDRAGMSSTKIFASGDLNEYRIADLINRGAPIDAFGVGTELVTSYDAPALGGIYKLVGQWLDGHLRMRVKLSQEKATYPGPKQVWRLIGPDGRYLGDVVALADEAQPAPSARPLLEQVMVAGKAIGQYADRSREARRARLDEARSRAARELERLPPELLSINSQASYPVNFSQKLECARARLQEQMVAPDRASG
jgi:nicotinate phosphoribosyltransferase